MKTFKAICAAAVIALSLSMPAYADDPAPGDIHVPGKPCPITTDGTVTSTTDTDGATTVDGDISFSALADLILTLTTIF